MAMNFNVGGNNGKKIVTEEEYDDIEELDEIEEITEESSTSTKVTNALDVKKMTRLMGIIILIIVGILLVVFLFSALTGGNKSYEEIEEIMISAAESYFNDHQESLPKKEGGAQTVDVSALVAGGYMKELSKYTDSACTGSVKVEKAGGTYIYLPNLNCGESYESQILSEKIRSDNPVVTSGYGLYHKNGNYVFRGEKVNNYVQLDNAVWRIVKITNGNEIVLVKDAPLGTLVPWDDRYNEVANYNAGINNFSSSRLKESLLELYTTKDETVVKSLLSDKDKSKMVSFNQCIGKRATNETGVEQAVECKEVAKDQKIGLLTAADYMTASIDTKCTSPSNPTCQNYNYLLTDVSWWLATASTTSTYHTYIIDANSGIKETNANMYARIRPVIHLNTNVLYKSGTGTKEDPYITK